jgi:hypothetical protein
MTRAAIRLSFLSPSPEGRGVRGEVSKIFIVFFLSTLLLSGCTPKNSARGVVDQFIEARYITIDHQQMQSLCSGLALDKIHDEMKLTEGQSIDQSTRKPVVHYSLQQTRNQAEDRVTYLFKARIDVPEGGSFQKFWMITARQSGGVWKVSNYSEYD